jgi:predicted TIM-barrel fold metal-dependent hydrolase
MKAIDMFGSDYPYFSYQRLFPDWEAEGFKPQVLEKVFYKNAERVLDLR